MAGRGARIRLGAVIAALVILPTVGTLGITAPGALAATAAVADYPSWQDVKNAQASEAATKKQVAAIKAELVRLQAEVAQTQAVAEAAGIEYEKAQNAYDEQALIAQKYQEQADAAQAESGASRKAAKQLLAELGKTGGGDLTANLLGESDSADSLLYRLGAMSQAAERSQAIYAEALRQQKAAQALTDQADVEKAKLEEYRIKAEAAFQAAQAAAQAAADKLEEQQAHQAELEAQLAVLVEKRQATEADYIKGLRAKYGPGAAGEVSASGWARPAAGYISSPFGYRYHPIYHQWIMHNGTDIAGAGCGAPIYAAHAGTVTYAGPNGTLGNYIQINHGDGSSTGYGHIVAGGIMVRIGEYVGPGQNIARVGSTGASTGCHLHFLVRVNGNLTDPVPFMRNRGITLG
jgi:murein DD-endopeptidase MepM/ murein hydrolase activator NlpD